MKLGVAKKPDSSSSSSETTAPDPTKKSQQTAGPGLPLYVQASAMQTMAPTRDHPTTMDKGSGADVGGDKLVGLASHGVAHAAAPLPHLDRIQQAFGEHDVGHVKAAVGGEGAHAAGQMGARAYAKGDRVAFGQQPDLRLAAHEAAHVVQQRGGVQLDGGVGKAGDQHEKQANAVADAVVAGKSAESMLGPKKDSGGATGVQMACSCGGSCSACGGGGVQMEPDSATTRSWDPMSAPGVSFGGPVEKAEVHGGASAMTKVAEGPAGDGPPDGPPGDEPPPKDDLRT